MPQAPVAMKAMDALEGPVRAAAGDVRQACECECRPWRWDTFFLGAASAMLLLLLLGGMLLLARRRWEVVLHLPPSGVVGAGHGGAPTPGGPMLGPLAWQLHA